MVTPTTQQGSSQPSKEIDTTTGSTSTEARACIEEGSATTEESDLIQYPEISANLGSTLDSVEPTSKIANTETASILKHSAVDGTSTVQMSSPVNDVASSLGLAQSLQDEKPALFQPAITLRSRQAHHDQKPPKTLVEVTPKEQTPAKPARKSKPSCSNSKGVQSKSTMSLKVSQHYDIPDPSSSDPEKPMPTPDALHILKTASPLAKSPKIAMPASATSVETDLSQEKEVKPRKSKSDRSKPRGIQPKGADPFQLSKPREKSAALPTKSSSEMTCTLSDSNITALSSAPPASVELEQTILAPTTLGKTTCESLKGVVPLTSPSRATPDSPDFSNVQSQKARSSPKLCNAELQNVALPEKIDGAIVNAGSTEFCPASAGANSSPSVPTPLLSSSLQISSSEAGRLEQPKEMPTKPDRRKKMAFSTLENGKNKTELSDDASERKEDTISSNKSTDDLANSSNSAHTLNQTIFAQPSHKRLSNNVESTETTTEPTTSSAKLTEDDSEWAQLNAISNLHGSMAGDEVVSPSTAPKESVPISGSAQPVNNASTAYIHPATVQGQASSVQTTLTGVPAPPEKQTLTKSASKTRSGRSRSKKNQPIMANPFEPLKPAKLAVGLQESSEDNSPSHPLLDSSSSTFNQDQNCDGFTSTSAPANEQAATIFSPLTKDVVLPSSSIVAAQTFESNPKLSASGLKKTLSQKSSPSQIIQPLQPQPGTVASVEDPGRPVPLMQKTPEESEEGCRDGVSVPVVCSNPALVEVDTSYFANAAANFASYQLPPLLSFNSMVAEVSCHTPKTETPSKKRSFGRASARKTKKGKLSHPVESDQIASPASPMLSDIPRTAETSAPAGVLTPSHKSPEVSTADINAKGSIDTLEVSAVKKVPGAADKFISTTLHREGSSAFEPAVEPADASELSTSPCKVSSALPSKRESMVSSIVPSNERETTIPPASPFPGKLTESIATASKPRTESVDASKVSAPQHDVSDTSPSEGGLAVSFGAPVLEKESMVSFGAPMSEKLLADLPKSSTSNLESDSGDSILQVSSVTSSNVDAVTSDSHLAGTRSVPLPVTAEGIELLSHPKSSTPAKKPRLESSTSVGNEFPTTPAVDPSESEAVDIDIVVVDVTQPNESNCKPTASQTDLNNTNPTKRKSAFDILGSKPQRQLKKAVGKHAAGKASAGKSESAKDKHDLDLAKTDVELSSTPKLAKKQLVTVRQKEIESNGSPTTPTRTLPWNNDGPVNPFFKPRTRTTQTSSGCTLASALPITSNNSTNRGRRVKWILASFPDASINHVGYIPSKVGVKATQTLLTEKSVTNVAPAHWPFNKGVHDLTEYDDDEILPAECSPFVKVYEEVATCTDLEEFMRLDEVKNLSMRINNFSADTLHEFAALHLQDGSSDNLWHVTYQPAYAKLLYDGSETEQSINAWLQTWVVQPEPNTNPLQEDTQEASRSSYFSDGSLWENSMDGCNKELLAAMAMPVHVLVGESGLGKSSMVHYIAEKLGFLVQEVHAGVLRSAAQLKAVIGEATQSCAIGKTRELNRALVLIDDVDIVFEEDKNFFSGLKTIVDRAKCPILFTCNRIPQEFAQTFGDRIIIHKVEHNSRDDLIQAAQYIAIAQGIEVGNDQLGILFDHVEDKFCTALHQLQFHCDLLPSIKEEAVIDISSPQGKQHSNYRVLTPRLLSNLPSCHDKLELMGVNNCDSLDLVGSVYEAALQFFSNDSPSCTKPNCRFHLPCWPADPVINFVRPSFGPLHGGTEVFISGLNFSHPEALRVAVFVGRQACEIIEASPTFLLVKIPPHETYKVLSETQESLGLSASASESTLKLSVEAELSVDPSIQRVKSQSQVSNDPPENVAKESSSDSADDSDFEEPLGRRQRRAAPARAAIPKRRRIHARATRASSLRVQTDTVNDEIEESDDHDLLAATQTQSPEDSTAGPRDPSPILANPRPKQLRAFDRLVQSRVWPVDIHLSIELPKMVRLSSLNSVARRHNGFFEYSSLEDQSQFQIETKKSLVQVPSPPETLNLNNCSMECDYSASLKKLSEIAEWGSLCDKMLAIPNSRSTTGRMLQQHLNYEDTNDTEGDQYDSTVTQLRIAAEYQELGAQIYSRSLHGNKLHCVHRDRELETYQRTFLRSAQGCTEAALPLLSLGPSRGRGLASSRNTHSSLLDHMSYLSCIAKIDDSNEATHTGRRVFRHYMNRPGLNLARELVHDHAERFWLYTEET